MKPETLFFILVLGSFVGFCIYGLYYYERRSKALDDEENNSNL